MNGDDLFYIYIEQQQGLKYVALIMIYVCRFNVWGEIWWVQPSIF